MIYWPHSIRQWGQFPYRFNHGKKGTHSATLINYGPRNPENSFMAQTFQQIKKQIEDLEKRAAERRRIELSSVIKRTREAIATWQLTPQDLFDDLRGTAKAKPTKTGSTRSSGTKYANGNGGTWGGIGKRPRWLSEALAAGARMSDFLVKEPASQSGPAPEPAAARSKRVVSARRQAGGAPTRSAAAKVATKARYSDGKGQSWSGRGPKPKWVKSALAAGKSLEELAT